MDDDWRLQIDLDDDGVGGELADHLRSSELKHELEVDFAKRVIVSHEGERIFLYAGDRASLDSARPAIQKFLDAKGWQANLDLRHWHKVAEDWEDPDAAEPATAAEKEAEHERLMKTEDDEVAAHHGRAEFEVRVEFPSHGEARDFAAKLKGEGLEPVRRWRYMVVGAADEDAAQALADRIRAEAPADAKVTAEGSLAAAWAERPVNPLFWLGGLGG
ncbi:MAG TPA: hypothetical protein VH299_11225 [Solirubrobacterales bacterium]|jgi:hypothetical protein|nr:hypothetical protein [Solirubrobacterales bacterium]